MLADERGSEDTTYTGQLRAFAGAVAGAGDVPTSAAHAVTTMGLIDDAYRAAGLLPGAPYPMTPAGTEAAQFAADLIRIDTTNRGGGDGASARRRSTGGQAGRAGVEPALLESAPGRRTWWRGSAAATPARRRCWCTATSTWCPRTRRPGACPRSPARSATACCGGAARWT